MYKGKKAFDLYGNRGRYGVICILTKSFIEYQATVLDAGFESFLTTQQSKHFYTESGLKARNIPMVAEWNSRCSSPSVYNPVIYEAAIDYDPQIDYGLEVEYRLYMFFRFMQKQHGISFAGNSLAIL